MSGVTLTTLFPSLKSIADLSKEKFDYKVSKNGGRNVTYIESKEIDGKEVKTEHSFKYKHLIAHINQLAREEWDAETLDMEDCRKVLKNVGFLWIKGEAYLKNATLWQKFMTLAKQLFGNIGEPRHLDVLKNLDAKYAYGEMSDEAQEIYEKLTKIKRSECSKCAKALAEQLAVIRKAYKKGEGEAPLKRAEAYEKFGEKHGDKVDAFKALEERSPEDAHVIIRMLSEKNPHLAFLLGAHMKDTNLLFIPASRKNKIEVVAIEIKERSDAKKVKGRLLKA